MLVRGALLLRQGLPRSSLFRVPLGRGEQAKDQPRAPHAGARRDARAFAQGTGCALSEPRSLLAKSRGHGCPRDRGREGAFFFGYFLLGKQKKVTRPPG